MTRGTNPRVFVLSGNAKLHRIDEHITGPDVADNNKVIAG